jgi:hypothetical protein
MAGEVFISYRRAIRQYLTRFILLLCLFVFLVAPSVARAESDEVEARIPCWFVGDITLCHVEILVKGEITTYTIQEVQALLKLREAWARDRGGDGHDGDRLSIDSPGGNVAAAMSIGRMLRSARMGVTVEDHGQCVSACVLVLAAGVTRGVSGKVGIHRPFFDVAVGTRAITPDEVRSNYQKMLQNIRAYLREMNVSERLADDMLAIEPAKVRYLSENEQLAYGLGRIDPIEQETVDIEEAQRLGVDRREYMRRKSRVGSECFGSSRSPVESIVDCYNRIMNLGR